MKKLVTLIFGLFLLINIANSHLKIASNNNIGIGTDNPISKLSIGNVGNTYAKVYIENTALSGSSIKTLQISQPSPTSNCGWAYGTVSTIGVGTTGTKHVGIVGGSYTGTALADSRTYGGYLYAGNATSGYNYGLYALLYGSNNGTAIFGGTPNKVECLIPGIFAAYLSGKVFIEDNVGIKNTSPQYTLDVVGDINATGAIRVNGVSIGSDISLKKDIRDVESGSLEKIQLLNGVIYKYKVPEDLVARMSSVVKRDTGIVEEPLLIPNPEFYETDQIGFIAQDLQKVFPQLVTENKEGTLGINYLGLIPLLVEAMKEQQTEIEELKAKLNELVPFEKP